MSDIFSEVDEDIRKEKYSRLWDRFGLWVIAVAVLIVVGTGGYRGWLYWQETQAQQAGDTFFEAVSLSEEGSFQEAAALYGELETAVGGYPALARMRMATDLAVAGQVNEAIAEFDAVSREDSVMPALRDVAAIRAGYLAVDQEDFASVADRVEKLTGDTGPFRSAARELLALSAWKNGDNEMALTWVSAVQEDPSTPVDVSRRVSILADILRSAGATAAGPDSEGSDQ